MKFRIKTLSKKQESLLVNALLEYYEGKDYDAMSPLEKLVHDHVEEYLTSEHDNDQINGIAIAAVMDAVHNKITDRDGCPYQALADVLGAVTSTI